MLGGVAIVLLSVLSLAAWLTPSTSGFGTHEQIRFRSGAGLQPCTWATISGKPCPTCGMTTAFAHAAEGDLLASFHAQPFGAILAVVTSMAFWITLHSALTGSAAVETAVAAMGRRALWTTLALLALGWGYKIVVWPGS